MALSEEAKELLRDAILMQLQAARPAGLKMEPIQLGAKLAGFQTLGKEDLAKQLRYLEAHKMIDRADRTINKAVDLWMITQTGTAHLDDAGLI